MDFLPENEEPKKKKGGFNSYWLFGLLIVALLATQFLTLNLNIKPTTEDEFFRKLVPSGDVAQITIVNKDREDARVEVYIKEDSLKTKKQYSDFKQNKIGFANKGPLYSFELTSATSFKDKLDAIQSQTPFEKLIKVKNETQKSIFDLLLSVLPFILLFGVWFFLNYT